MFRQRMCCAALALAVASTAAGSSARADDKQAVRAVYGDRQAYADYALAEERALHAGLMLAKHASEPDTEIDVEELAAVAGHRDAAAEAWRDVLTAYATDAGKDTVVFVGLHPRIAFRLLMDLMRPRVRFTEEAMSVTRIDAVTARWLVETAMTRMEGRTADTLVYTRLLRERVQFVPKAERRVLLRMAIATFDRLLSDLYGAGIPVDGALSDALVPGLGALAVGDPCAGDDTRDDDAGRLGELTTGDIDAIARLGVSMDDIKSQLEIDCSGAGGASRGGGHGYGDVGNAMDCLGQLFGGDEEPTDFGMCMAAGLGSDEPGAIRERTVHEATSCGSSVADKDGANKYDPFQVPESYDRRFIEPELRKGKSPIQQPPEDEDKKRREEINKANDRSTIVTVPGSVIIWVGKMIVKAVKALIKWVKSLFASDEQEGQQTGADADGGAGGDGDGDDGSGSGGDGDGGSGSGSGSGGGGDSGTGGDGGSGGDGDDTPDAPDSGTTLPGPDGGGCVEPWMEVAEACFERMMEQIPGYAGRTSIERKPGEIDPRVARPWEGSPSETVEAISGCFGTAATPGKSLGCGQLTQPPGDCASPAVSAAAQMFAASAEQELFCMSAMCDPSQHCECTDGPMTPPGDGGSPGPGPVDGW